MKFALALVASAAACMNTMDLSTANLIKFSDVRTRREASGDFKEAWRSHPKKMAKWNGPTHKGCLRTWNGGLVFGDRVEVELEGGRQPVSRVNVFIEPTFDASRSIEGA